MRELKGLSYRDRVGLLFEAHFILKSLLDLYFRRSGVDPGEDLTHIHLELRVLVEEILAGPEFGDLKKRYHCPFKSLYSNGRPPDFSWTYDRRPRVDRFHATIVEAHARAGSPQCPRIEPYYTLLKGLRMWLDHANRFPWVALKRSLADLRALANDARAGEKKRATGRSRCRRGKLSKAEESEREQHHYNCLDTLHIPGVVTEKGNVVILNKKKATVKDREFPLLLRLIVELKKGKGGWVSIHDLHTEGLISDPGRYQPYSNLRAAVESQLLESNGSAFVERDKIEKKRYRVSMLPCRVTYDKEKLLDHPKGDVKRVAKRLPRSRTPKK